MNTERGLPLSPSLLLVISDPDNREALRAMLTREGCRVLALGSCADALQQLRHQHYEAALLDIGPPVGGGASVLQDLLELDPKLPVITFATDAAAESQARPPMTNVYAHLSAQGV